MLSRAMDRKTRKLIKAGWFAILLLGAWVLFSPWGAIRYHRVSKNLRQIEAENAELRDDSRQLKDEINLLTNDPAYIEKIARKEHGLLKNNELVYDFSDR